MNGFFATCDSIGGFGWHHGFSYDNSKKVHEITIKHREGDEKNNKYYYPDVIPGAGFNKM